VLGRAMSRGSTGLAWLGVSGKLGVHEWVGEDDVGARHT
jgi:F420-0:gamma-glutamyl ligase